MSLHRPPSTSQLRAMSATQAWKLEDVLNVSSLRYGLRTFLHCSASLSLNLPLPFQYLPLVHATRRRTLNPSMTILADAALPPSGPGNARIASQQECVEYPFWRAVAKLPIHRHQHGRGGYQQCATPFLAHLLTSPASQVQPRLRGTALCQKFFVHRAPAAILWRIRRRSR